MVRQVLANLLALAAVCPFVGSLSDLMGRRYVAILGACMIIVAMIVASTAHSMNVFIGEQIDKSRGARVHNISQAAWLLQALEPVSTSSQLSP